MDPSADDFMVIEEKYSDFSVFGHGDSLTYRLFPWPGCAG